MKREYAWFAIAVVCFLAAVVFSFLQDKYLATWSGIFFVLSLVSSGVGFWSQFIHERRQAEHAARKAHVHFAILATLPSRVNGSKLMAQYVPRLFTAARDDSPLTPEKDKKNDTEIFRQLASYDILEIAEAGDQLEARVAPEYKEAVKEALAGSLQNLASDSRDCPDNSHVAD